MTMYIDQYGQKFYARTVRELRHKIGDLYGLTMPRASLMYRDRKGETYHVGYVIKDHWLEGYKPIEKPTLR